MKQLGTQLRALRKNANLSFEELSRLTRIPIHYLKHLEKEEYEKLPPPVYTKGFLRFWAQATGGDEAALQNAFIHRKRSTFLENNRVKKRIRVFRSRPIITVRHLVAVGIIVVLVSLVYVYYNQSIITRSPQVKITHPVELHSVSADKAITLTGTVQQVDTLTIDGSAVDISDGSFSHDYLLDNGWNTIPFLATYRDNDPVQIIRRVIYLEEK